MWSRSRASMCVRGLRLPEAVGRVDPRTRARVDHNGLAMQGANPAVTEGHLDRFRRHEAAVPHDEFRAARPVLVEVHRDQPVDHLAFAVADPGHLDLPVARGDPELGAPPEIRGDLCCG